MPSPRSLLLRASWQPARSSSCQDRRQAHQGRPAAVRWLAVPEPGQGPRAEIGAARGTDGRREGGGCVSCAIAASFLPRPLPQGGSATSATRSSCTWCHPTPSATRRSGGRKRPSRRHLGQPRTPPASPRAGSSRDTALPRPARRGCRRAAELRPGRPDRRADQPSDLWNYLGLGATHRQRKPRQPVTSGPDTYFWLGLVGTFGASQRLSTEASSRKQVAM